MLWQRNLNSTSFVWAVLFLLRTLAPNLVLTIENTDRIGSFCHVVVEMPGTVIRSDADGVVVRFAEIEVEVQFPAGLFEPASLARYGQAVWYRLLDTDDGERRQVIVAREVSPVRSFMAEIERILDGIR